MRTTQRIGGLLGRLLATVIGGALLVTAGTLTVYFAGFPHTLGVPEESFPQAIALLMGVPAVILALVSIVVGVTAPTIGKAWRRLLIPSGLLVWGFPLAILVMSAGFLPGPDTASTGEMAGGMLATTAVSGVVGFFAFFLGGILVVAGALVGRDKEYPPT